MELSFYARGDSSTANNASLNAVGTSTVPTTLLTFTNLSDPANDLQLDFNSGQPDSDTWVIVNGVTYTFTVEMVAYLPSSNKLSNVNGLDLRGDPVTVITLSNGQRYFFVTDQQLSLETMTQFPNGAHTLTGVSTMGPPVLICFAAGTLVETPQGPRPIESLEAGDLVQTAEGHALPVLWRGDRTVSRFEAMRCPTSRAIVIPPGAFGPGCPARPLRLSPSHRIARHGGHTELLFGVPKVLLPAGHLVGHAGIHRDTAATETRFHHILLAEHAMVMAEGVESESLQPGDRMVYGGDPRQLSALLAALPEDALQRPDRYPTLKHWESDVLMAAIRRSDRQQAA
jgi:Hint domain